MSSHWPPLPLSAPGLSSLLLPRMPRLYCALIGMFVASYHSQCRPMLMRFATKYHRSHSRSRTVLRLKPLPELRCGGLEVPNCCAPKLMLPQPTAPKSRPPPELQSTSLRSKCVPNRTDRGVVAEPVNHPFGLHRNRSWPIRKLWPMVLPRFGLLLF